MKNFLSLFNVLFFCTFCNKPCGDMKKHVTEMHEGEKNSIQMEFDHMLPLCGLGHVEKNVLGATITVLWELIGFDNLKHSMNS